ncbi:dormancy-associated protein homolog 3-like isoform X2 [Impatiens glandulifera]|uniref:dormancy-associated protein homolog 3-like isoform X2 n=1 Tax=Impatiens glandulifera TaxID=253017 RepID=UPI001FB17BD8|nr:dormancy-associated protein homolog 3-like isoform X2 [Impatiens glandulifera]
MSLLEKLWDDTLAGPRPENGLGKLRKKPSSNLGSGSDNKPPPDGARAEVRVTRSIMIVKPPHIINNPDGTPPASPAASPAGTPPVSPFASAGREAFKLMRRKSLSDAYEKQAAKKGEGIRRPPFNDV